MKKLPQSVIESLGLVPPGATYVDNRVEGGDIIVSVILPGTPPEGEEQAFKFDVSVDVEGETE